MKTSANGTEARSQRREPTRHGPVRLNDLGDQERGVVDLLARGCVDRDIAFALGLSEVTVKCDLARVRRRLGARNRVDIVRLAIIE